MRIGESAGVEQIRRERGVLGFFRFAVDVGIAEQTFARPLALPDVESDNDDVYVGLAACVRAPGEGAMREGDLQPQRSKRSGQSCATCSPWVMELVATKPIRADPFWTYFPASINQAVT